jgi:hypothetical protein
VGEHLVKSTKQQETTMFRLSCLVATGALALTIGAANATVFDVTGSGSLPLSGTITISGGSVTGEDVTSTDSIYNPFDALTSSTSGGAGFWDITLNTGGLPGNSLLLVLPVSSLSGYSGGGLSATDLYQTGLGPEEFIDECDSGSCGSLTAQTSPPTTPLPATLPLFAGGLGFVGYLTGRKKRKAGQALAAA